MSNFRKIVSVLLVFAFAVVGVSGVVMQFFVKGHLLNEVHAWVGEAMVVAAAVHIVLNWKLLAGYFRQRWMFALALPFVAFALVLASAGQGEQRGGVNPRALMHKMTGARVTDVARVLGKEPEAALATLRATGLKVDSADQTLEQIGQANHRAPEAVLGSLAE